MSHATSDPVPLTPPLPESASPAERLLWTPTPGQDLTESLFPAARDFRDLVRDKRVVTQDDLQAVLGHPPADSDRAAVISAIRKVYPDAAIVPARTVEGKWELVWGTQSDVDEMLARKR